jgi:signal recognition particle subunit SRP54
MGSLKDLLGMLPGVNSAMLNDSGIDDKSMTHVEAIVHSMTKDERRYPNILNGPRRARIALGSGTSIQEVNRLIKQFTEMQKMIKKMSRGKVSNSVKQLMQTKLPS